MEDKDFLQLYQVGVEDVCFEEQDSSLVEMMFDGKDPSPEFMQKCLDAAWRLLSVGIITGIEHSITFTMNELIEDYEENNTRLCWWGVRIEPTDFGIKFASKYGLGKVENEFVRKVLPEYKEALTDLFNKAGVGFDKECPYKVPKEIIK